MNLLQISQCAIRLDFKPCTPWPEALPAIAFEGCLVGGLSCSPGHPVFNWSSPEELSSTKTPGLFASKSQIWCHLFKSIYPSLSLPELARLKLTPYHHLLDWEDLLKAYHLRPSDSLERLFVGLQLLSPEQQAWVSAKALSAQDLMIALSVPHDILAKNLNLVIESGLSKSQAVQSLEWLCELSMMEGPHMLTLKANETPDQFFQKIKTLRYKNTTARDSELERNLQLPWPLGSKSQFLRRGDRVGFELKIFVTNPTELRKNLTALEKVATEWRA